MTPDYSHSLEKPYKPLRRPYPITNPLLKEEIQDCILYYNNLEINDVRDTIEWINSTRGYVLGRIRKISPKKNEVKRCSIQDIQEILNISGRWLKRLRGCENNTSGPVPKAIIHYAYRLKPHDMPEISYYKEGKNLSDKSKRSTNSRSKRGDT